MWVGGMHAVIAAAIAEQDHSVPVDYGSRFPNRVSTLACGSFFDAGLKTNSAFQMSYSCSR